MWTPAFGFILGSCLGSFLNVNIDRLPREQSLLYPPSHCAVCDKKLRPFELIPLLSYIWLRGKCRYCGAAIPRRILAVELGSGLLFAVISFEYGLTIEFLVLAFYTSLFLVLAIIDLEHSLILNKITYPAVAISLVLAPFWSNLGFPRTFLGEDTMLSAFLSALIGGVIFAGLFFVVVLLLSGGMGWGDVKMGGLVGLATGFPSVLVAMMISFLSSGLVAIFLLLFLHRGRKEAIPFAPFLALGAFVALVWGKDLVTWYWGL